MKEAFSIGWENKNLIYAIEKKMTKMISDLRNENE